MWRTLHGSDVFDVDAMNTREDSTNRSSFVLSRELVLREELFTITRM